MTDLRKAAEMALKYFEDAYEVDVIEFEIKETLRQALAEPANSTTDFVEPKAPSQTEQEPYGYFGYDFRLDAWIQNPDDIRGIPFYTAPPKREWVGLTEREILDLYQTYGEIGDFDYERAIEAKLKEKNT